MTTEKKAAEGPVHIMLREALNTLAVEVWGYTDPADDFGDGFPKDVRPDVKGRKGPSLFIGDAKVDESPESCREQMQKYFEAIQHEVKERRCQRAAFVIVTPEEGNAHDWAALLSELASEVGLKGGFKATQLLGPGRPWFVTGEPV